MVLITAGTIFAGLGGFLTWITNLPEYMKYIIFLVGLGIDAGVLEAMFHTNGLVGTLINMAGATFQLTLSVTTSQVLLLALFIPLMGYFFKMYH